MFFTQIHLFPHFHALWSISDHRGITSEKYISQIPAKLVLLGPFQWEAMSGDWRWETKLCSSLSLSSWRYLYQCLQWLCGCSSAVPAPTLQLILGPQLLPRGSSQDFQILLGSQLCCLSNSPSSKFPALMQGPQTMGSCNISSCYRPSSPSNGSSTLYLIIPELSSHLPVVLSAFLTIWLASHLKLPSWNMTWLLLP